MRSRFRRLGAVLIGLVAAMALAGCDVTGTMKVRADDQVELDLRVMVEDGGSCAWQLGPDVRTYERRNRGSGRLCLLQGTVPKDQLRRWGVDISHTGEHFHAVFNPLGVTEVAGGASVPFGLRDVGVEVEFPGQVLESTGIVEGNTVRFTDVGRLNQPGGMRAVALDHQGPPLSVVVPLAAFVLGGGLAVAGLWASARRRALLAATVRAAPRLGAKPDPGRAATEPTDVAVVARPEPGSLLPADLADALGADGGATGWERPGSVATAEEPVADPVPDHRKWAPPD